MCDLNLLSESSIFIHIPRVTVRPLQVKALSKIILCMPQEINAGKCKHIYPGLLLLVIPHRAVQADKREQAVSVANCTMVRRLRLCN